MDPSPQLMVLSQHHLAGPLSADVVFTDEASACQIVSKAWHTFR